ncbi:MAG: hypothetical protein EBY28_23670 [Betaproteobacteria bacterium]|nr:hypothetical protein [Betaproteobacteria bacterium]
MLMEAVRLAGGTDRAKVVEALNKINGLAVSNGTASFSASKRLLVEPRNLAMFEYVKNDKNQVALQIAK